MRVIHLQHGRRYQHECEFTDINRDRIDNNISLEFYLADCECGAQGLYLVEQPIARVAYFKTDWDTVPEPYYETITIDCPANCGGTLRLAFTDVHPQHGLKVRCLEAWTRRVEVQGLELNEQKHNHKTHGISIYHNPEHDSVEVDIHVHITRSDQLHYANDHDAIMHAVHNKLRDIPHSRTILR